MAGLTALDFFIGLRYNNLMPRAEVQAFYRTGPGWNQPFNFWFKQVQMTL